MASNPPALPPGIFTPDDPTEPDDEPATANSAPLLLTDVQRKALLGKLAEFEVLLLNLAPRQQSFALAYLSDPTNASAAARKAGYIGNVALRASKLLNQEKMAAVIAAGQQLREDRTYITSERTLHELAIIAFSDISNFSVGPGGKVSVVDGVPEYAMRAVSSAEYTVTEIDTEDKVVRTYKTRIKLWSKTEALRMLAMYQKLLSGENGINLVLNQDNRGQTHTHNYQHNEWQWGDRKVKF